VVASAAEPVEEVGCALGGRASQKLDSSTGPNFCCATACHCLGSSHKLAASPAMLCVPQGFTGMLLGA
jgi:hypothetical protein